MIKNVSHHLFWIVRNAFAIKFIFDVYFVIDYYNFLIIYYKI